MNFQFVANSKKLPERRWTLGFGHAFEDSNTPGTSLASTWPSPSEIGSAIPSLSRSEPIVIVGTAERTMEQG